VRRRLRAVQRLLRRKKSTGNVILNRGHNPHFNSSFLRPSTHWLIADLQRGIERGLLTTSFGGLTFDCANDPLIHVCDLLRLIGVTALFAYERIIGEIFVAQVNHSIRPRLLPRSQLVEHPSEINAVELQMKFFAHNGHNDLARFGAAGKSFLVAALPAT